MHTQERLQVDATEKYWVVGEETYDLVAVTSGTPRTTEEERENAQRLVACWNAMSGLSTEQVAGLDVARLVEALGSAIREIEYYDMGASRDLLVEIRAVLAGLEKVTP